MLRPQRLALAALALCCLNACTYTFVPLIPEKVKAEQRLVVGPATTLERQDSDIVLTVGLGPAPEEGYLSAFLYRGDEKVGENSQLIGPDTKNVVFRFPGAQVGEYRAVLFWRGEILRQVELTVT